MKKDRADTSSRDSEGTLPPPVKLRPLFGIAPEHYLPLLMLLVLLVILFLVFFLPALRRPGEPVKLHSSPPGSAVYVDGRRVDATPAELFLERGTREIVLRHPWFQDKTVSADVGNQLFRIPFHSRSRDVFYRLQLDEPDDLITDSVREFAHWALAEQPAYRHRGPDVLSEAVLAWYADPARVPTSISGGSDAETGNASQLDVLLALAPALLEHSGSGRDYLRALSLDRGAGGVLSAPGALEIVQTFIHLQNDTHAAFAVLEAVLPEKTAERFLESEWYGRARDRVNTAAAAHSLEETPLELDAPQTAVFAGVEFVRIPPIEALVGMQRDEEPIDDSLRIPHLLQLDEFWLMRTPVSNAQFAEFLEDNPGWGREHLEELREQGLVTPDHLADWDADERPNADGGFEFEAGQYRPDNAGNDELDLDYEEWLQLPVRYVSHPVAEEFASWFSERLAETGEELASRLPYSEEWEFAALLDGADLYEPVFRDGFVSGPVSVEEGAEGNLGFRHLMGNTWEWTASPYLPSTYALRPFQVSLGDLPELSSELAGAVPFRAVRGGSWANQPDEVALAAVGVQPRHFSSPFLGFRLAVVPRDRTDQAAQ